MTKAWPTRSSVIVIPAKAGIHISTCAEPADIHGAVKWIPAFAGMTELVVP
jgi:hypothetical protein